MAGAGDKETEGGGNGHSFALCWEREVEEGGDEEEEEEEEVVFTGEEEEEPAEEEEEEADIAFENSVMHILFLYSSMSLLIFHRILSQNDGIRVFPGRLS